MPPQSVEVAETIAALKRARRREKEAPSDQPISSATNRGNKLKRGAGFVHAGSLPYRYTKHGYKERIEHAGYQRYILSRNPKRYNEYGDELEDSESDQEADADAEDENPYSEVRLEELLKPLTHPSELENHPSLRQAYIDPALPDMLQTTEEKLRLERANLWRAKNLQRHFIGDESWIPCASVEQAEDWDLFSPMTSEIHKLSPGKKRKRDSDAKVALDGVDGQDHAGHAEELSKVEPHPSLVNGSGLDDIQPDSEPVQSRGRTSNLSGSNDDLSNEELGANNHIGDIRLNENGAEEATAENAEQQSNEITSEEVVQGPDPSISMDHTDSATLDQEGIAINKDADAPELNGDNDPAVDGDIGESPPPPPRRITRALAATNTSNTATPPLSPTDSTTSSTIDSTLLQPHPIYLLPPRVQIEHSTHQHSNLPLHVAHSGLAIDEILETRRLLGMYIQKQEETIRGLEGVLGKLIKAKRMRDQVWEWSKAEGHVGEWSDGEDWIDAEAWGIAASELRKGKDEDNNEEEEIGRKGKRRRGGRDRE